MPDEDPHLAGRRFEDVDLTGTRVHGAFVAGTKVTDAFVRSLDLSGHVESLVVNGVEVAGYVQAELERRHPELALLDATDAAGLQQAWGIVRDVAAATLAVARSVPAAALDESVDGEFSYLQTLRHLVFATDRWITGPVRGEADPFHPLGCAYLGASAEELAPLDPDARPTLDEVLAVRDERAGFVDELLRDATHDSLARVVDSPNGGATTVAGCFGVVVREEWWHHTYADRDLAILAAAAAQ